MKEALGGGDAEALVELLLVLSQLGCVSQICRSLKPFKATTHPPVALRSLRRFSCKSSTRLDDLDNRSVSLFFPNPGTVPPVPAPPTAPGAAIFQRVGRSPPAARFPSARRQRRNADLTGWPTKASDGE